VVGAATAVFVILFAPWLSRGILGAAGLAGAVSLGAVVMFFAALNGSQVGALSGLEAFSLVALGNLVRGIAFIVFAQRIGLTLEEIGAELRRLPADRAPTGSEWSRLSRTWTSRIDARIAELERLRIGLTECIGCGCLSLDRCQLANPGDRAARLGPGPRYWIAD